MRIRQYILKSLTLIRYLTIFYKSVEIIFLTALIITDLSTKFNFRNYYFLTLFIALSILIIAILIYLDIEYSILLINRIFLLE